jgi:hypothetical protein
MGAAAPGPFHRTAMPGSPDSVSATLLVSRRSRLRPVSCVTARVAAVADAGVGDAVTRTSGSASGVARNWSRSAAAAGPSSTTTTAGE